MTMGCSSRDKPRGILETGEGQTPANVGGVRRSPAASPYLAGLRLTLPGARPRHSPRLPPTLPRVTSTSRSPLGS